MLNLTDLSGNAIELWPGGIYIIQPTKSMDPETFQRVRADLNEEGQRLGVKFLLLDSILEVATKRTPESVVFANAGTGLTLNMAEEPMVCQ